MLMMYRLLKGWLNGLVGVAVENKFGHCETTLEPSMMNGVSGIGWLRLDRFSSTK
jgi:hypothetical protein